MCGWPVSVEAKKDCVNGKSFGAVREGSPNGWSRNRKEDGAGGMIGYTVEGSEQSGRDRGYECPRKVLFFCSLQILNELDP